MNQLLSIKEAILLIKKALNKFYPEKEVESFIYIIFDQLLNYSRIDIHTNFDTKLTDSVLIQIKDITEQLKQFKPIQYIFGKTKFFGLKFKVTPDVLIPRPETEELVQWILATTCDRELQIIDIGTGSGCIAVALSKYLPCVHIDAIDISTKALEIARFNANYNNVNIAFFQKDILKLKSSDFEKKYNVIVSNPPYVREQEKELMQKNVTEYEPHTALFVSNNNALIFYEAITHFASSRLENKGYLFFEINEMLAKDVANILREEKFCNIEIKKDINGKDRMICGQLFK